MRIQARMMHEFIVAVLRSHLRWIYSKKNTPWKINYEGMSKPQWKSKYARTHNHMRCIQWLSHSHPAIDWQTSVGEALTFRSELSVDSFQHISIKDAHYSNMSFARDWRTWLSQQRIRQNRWYAFGHIVLAAIWLRYFKVPHALQVNIGTTKNNIGLLACIVRQEKPVLVRLQQISIQVNFWKFIKLPQRSLEI
jgi:hypothetical protein